MKVVRRIDATEGEVASKVKTPGVGGMFRACRRFDGSSTGRIRPLPISPFRPEMAILTHDADFGPPFPLIA